MKLIDTHAHLYLSKTPVDVLVKRSQKSGIEHIICPGLDFKTSQTALDLASQYPEISAAIGVHPCEAPDFIAHEKEWEKLFVSENITIGEIGLDYYKMYHPKPLQQEVFNKQMTWAEQLNLPVILHNRSAEEDMIVAIKRFSGVRKVIHCFSGTPEFVQHVLDENTFFSVTATIEYSLSKKNIQALQDIPLSKLMLETDMPYLTPKKYKGQENEPSFLLETAKKLAEIKAVSLETLIKETHKTSRYFFSLKEEKIK
jgi:TatD DNase family protein